MNYLIGRCSIHYFFAPPPLFRWNPLPWTFSSHLTRFLYLKMKDWGKNNNSTRSKEAEEEVEDAITPSRDFVVVGEDAW